jgi:hypothetical protein
MLQTDEPAANIRSTIVKAGSLGPNIREANGKPPENPLQTPTPVSTP